MYKRALEFITKKHAGQKRNNGHPYIIHPIRVSKEMRSDTEKIVALLHDVLEDTEATIEELGEFGPAVVEAVIALTHQEGENYFSYIERLKRNEIARAVKIADISDNLKDNPSVHAMEKSATALEMLINN